MLTADVSVGRTRSLLDSSCVHFQSESLRGCFFFYHIVEISPTQYFSLYIMLSVSQLVACEHLLKHLEVFQMSGEACSALSLHSDSLLLHMFNACFSFDNNINTGIVKMYLCHSNSLVQKKKKRKVMKCPSYPNCSQSAKTYSVGVI